MNNILAIMSSNYVAIPDSNDSNYVVIPDPNNEQQYISTSHSYTSTISSYVPDQYPMQHVQNIPIQVTPLNMNVNFSQTNRSEVFRFDIPGFQIIVIPVSSPSNNSDMLNHSPSISLKNSNMANKIIII